MTTTLTIIAAVLALPPGLFISALMSQPRARLLSLLGGTIGDVAVAVAVYLVVTNAKISLDGLSYFLGTFFACSMGIFAGALVVNFLVGLAGLRSSTTAAEY